MFKNALHEAATRVKEVMVGDPGGKGPSCESLHCSTCARTPVWDEVIQGAEMNNRVTHRRNRS
jgi:hypothetical protein